MIKKLTFLVALVFASVVYADVKIIPMPTSVTVSGGTFVLQDEMTIAYEGKQLKPAAMYLNGCLATATGYNFKLKAAKEGDIVLRQSGKKDTQDESYTLSITEKGVVITSASYKGIIHGIATLRQVLPHEIESTTVVKGKTWSAPTLEVQDKPAYEWRGMMLDPVRHFYTVEETKRFIDIMALYKFSKFHWHLIDSQAWRIEIKKYPFLTSKGAWREENTCNIDVACEERAARYNEPTMHLPQEHFRMMDGKRMYGGFYTQEQIKEVVRYAAVRGIDVVPEIDMPGHNRTAATCYPWLGCAHDGTDPLCLGNDSTLVFAKNVFKEVFKLFPYGYTEIGGDEVKRTKWESCDLCKARVQKEGLKDMAELQSWFTRTMEKFFNKHGKRLIGWDEILEGGVSKTATVNWWQGHHTDVVQKSTAGGNEVICCPTTYLYFDYDQDSTTLKKIYTADIVPADLTPAQHALVKGMQANIWCEYIPTVARMQFMVFPRALALAEKAWTPNGQQNWDNFLGRVQEHTQRLKALKVHYRPLNEGYTFGLNTDWKKKK